mmetsp:Transcript_44482/g.96779  ORF Transcript_44482/g.96779 Transcript_44482/m.96779 type:complete len:481 (-) Transcript_44482:106-1548(-)|eukprot:CAMPEP_0170599100 /NCGR_PEP_ID=MMETSP0224-20130122/16607_1 /TAXON_ID=285029 /ORGANISM="Togula jolla, Strain CCCM 725" /LENGTH=480 /DNA_ID=CAMNT_0010923709 /DNA_START=61 /DNA_END=1503 /DNA_ORIENTATION=+
MSCIPCGPLGDTLFTYPTPRIVKIHDPVLATLRYIALAAIFIFIVGFHVMFQGSHLSVVPVNGVVRLQLRDPSEGNCDPFHMNCSIGFTSMAQLPYCKQNNYSGIYQKSCEYWDSVELRQSTDEGLLIPTRVLSFMQNAKCHPSPLNKWSCNGTLYDFVDVAGKVQPDKAAPKPVRDIFVADIERFELLLDHSAMSAGARKGTHLQEYDYDMAGFLLNCSESDQKSEKCPEMPVMCVHADCPPGSLEPRHMVQQTPRRRAASKQRSPGKLRQSYEALELDDEPQIVDEFIQADFWLNKDFVVSTHKGDIFRLDKLVKLAGVGLDTNVSKGSNETYRNDGFALVIRIEYTNISPWIGLQVFPWKPVGPKMRYTYHVMTHAAGDVKHRKVDYYHDPESQMLSREVEEFRGVRVVIEQIGSIKVWDTMQLMFLVTTTLGLLAITNCVLDSMALRCMKKSSEYESLKYFNAEPPEQGPVRLRSG